jgi:hypothetical protein
VSVRTSEEAAALARELLAKAAEVPPAERFVEMIEMGLINRDGELTKEFGGDAEPEPHRPTGGPAIAR